MVRITIRIPTPAELDAQKGVHTYSAYTESFAGSIPADATLLADQTQLPGFQRLAARAATDISQAYLRGRLTLHAMEMLPIDKQPALAQSAVYWVPVQAYYAAHGFGLATLVAAGAGEPKRHRTFLSSISQLARSLYPFPLNAACDGDTTVAACAGARFHNLAVASADVAALSTLRTPQDHEYPLFIGKSLTTTRTRALDEVFDNARGSKPKPGKKRRNLKAADKTRFVNRMHATTVFDLLFRMRLRSNYDDPRMYIFARLPPARSAESYRNLLKIIQAIRITSEAIIEKTLGKPYLDGLKRDFDDSFK